jgi:uncharacterized protein (UPF0333 family)
MKNNFLQKNKGYTLLFAVLVSSIVLSVGISILTISKKEFLLSSSARESKSAFYAADSGLECAVFNLTAGNFSTTTGAVTNINCLGGSQSITVPSTDTANFKWDVSPLDTGGGTFIFHVKTISTNACAVVSVHKYYAYDSDLGGLVPFTSIISKGYNLGWDSTPNTCSAASPKRVERALEMIL